VLRLCPITEIGMVPIIYNAGTCCQNGLSLDSSSEIISNLDSIG
jgi:hypothetical protein